MRHKKEVKTKHTLNLDNKEYMTLKWVLEKVVLISECNSYSLSLSLVNWRNAAQSLLKELD